MRSRVRSTRKKPGVFKWTKCMEDFVHGQLERHQAASVEVEGRERKTVADATQKIGVTEQTHDCYASATARD